MKVIQKGLRKITNSETPSREDKQEKDDSSLGSAASSVKDESEKKEKKHKSDKKEKGHGDDVKDKQDKKEKKHKSDKKTERETSSPEQNEIPNNPKPIKANNQLASLLQKGIDTRVTMQNDDKSNNKSGLMEPILQDAVSDHNAEALTFLQLLKNAVDSWTDDGSYSWGSKVVPPGVKQLRVDLTNLPNKDNAQTFLRQILKKLIEYKDSKDNNEKNALSLYKQQHLNASQMFPDLIEKIDADSQQRPRFV